MIKFQKRYFIELLEKKLILVTITMHTFFLVVFKKHLYYESALSRFEVLTKPLHKCNEDRPYYATQYQDSFIQYKEGFNFIPGIAEFKDTNVKALKAHLISQLIPKLVYEMDMLHHKSHPYIVNLKSTNFLENKIDLEPYIQMYRLMKNSSLSI